MPTRVSLVTKIQAPIEVCFDLSRDIGLHVQTMAHTAEEAIGGRTSGLIGPGESVTFRARHFGLRFKLTAQITAFDPPRYFQDTMVRGPFRSLRHEHRFLEEADGTAMVDEIELAAPGWPVSILIERAILGPYLHRLVAARNAVLKAAAEAQHGPGSAVPS